MHFVYLLIVVSLLLCLVNIGGWVCWPHVNISSAQYHLRGLLYDLELQSKTHGLTYWITSQVGSSGDLLPHVTDVHVVMLAHDLDTLIITTPPVTGHVPEGQLVYTLHQVLQTPMLRQLI